MKATIYCQDCKIYMCNKCEKNHLELFKNLNHIYKLDKNINKTFTGLCKEKNHIYEIFFIIKIIINYAVLNA